ncbi:MAG TPA: NAD(P)/FAD-dependent oxidoreductase [Anaerolineales bacterium]|nr:NAD(P)/FAD-dependent oxidoreductase [Anaerolineales bacterium]
MKARLVVIGAGIGGLTTAAVLARSGLDVTVLEAHVSPGGCAATYFHQGYRFDAGATLAGGFYPGGPMARVAQAAGIEAWPVCPADSAMCVHLPDGTSITRHAGDSRWEEIRSLLGAGAERFFRWQEQTADALWDLALRLPPWPPQSVGQMGATLAAGMPWLFSQAALSWPALGLDAFRPVAAHLAGASERLRLLVDGQLLISAQATSQHANALYGAAALDLPRRGVVHLAGGIGAIAETLVDAIRRHGGRVVYRQEATRIRMRAGRPEAVETKRGDVFPADLVFANLTPWNAAELLGEDLPPALRRLGPLPPDAWGAFVVYVGLDGASLPEGLPLHQQIIRRRPLGEGNSVFASLSPAWDARRAPPGHRALTLSTHTRLADWWRMAEQDRPAYEAQKAAMTEKLLAAAEAAIPGLRRSARLVLPGTPLTFQRFTRRKSGWVGGFPQTGLLRTHGPRLGPNLWLVGDSIFPGQSIAAVALGGLSVAQMVSRRLKTIEETTNLGEKESIP